MNSIPSTVRKYETGYIDSHQLVKALVAEKITEQAAEIIMEQFWLLQQKVQETQGNHATKDDVEISKLTLQKEIEEVKLTLQKEIDEVRSEVRQVELKLQKEIEQVKLTLQKEIEEVRSEVRQVELRLRKEIATSTNKTIRWFVGTVLVYSGLIMTLLAFFR